ncbi:hypothetical protein M0638_10000 [Roseomonas sp. NAR14]|uniref:Glycosyl transferase n=1 Tax=Roseomonas acroporae TaxID=2937791 RepID=A0A9X1Y6Y5_9PROT|nr:glycosyltransferase [Roseomonas acroporae]MCK8784713.1 hypothetical protein [Roseomonas acroporae]
MGRIPRIVHFVFGMAPDFGGKPWSLVHHACLMSAIRHLRPRQVLFHHAHEPTGPWWELSRPHLTLVRRQAPEEIFGRPLRHVAHRADVVRLQALIEHGGIYLDADVLVQRDFDDLLGHAAVMGREGRNGEFGAANAVILAEPNSAFLCRWLEEFRWFRSQGRDQYWAEHAVKVPSELALRHPDEVTMLPYTAFFWPLWTPDHIEWIFNSDRPIAPGAYANHLWEALAWDHLEQLTPGRVRRTDTNFHRWVAPYVADLPDNFGQPAIASRAGRLYRLTRRSVGAKLRSQGFFGMRFRTS